MPWFVVRDGEPVIEGIDKCLVDRFKDAEEVDEKGFPDSNLNLV